MNSQSLSPQKRTARNIVRFHRGILPALMAMLGLTGGLPDAVGAHEPVFGVGPHTVFRNGFAPEVEAEIEHGKFSTVSEFAYGITADLAVTANVPFVRRTENGADRSGFGDASLRLKWRFLRLDSPGATDQIAVVAGVKLPTGSSTGRLPPGTGSTDLLAALTYGHEGRRWYRWADVRYVLSGEGRGVDRGDVFFYDAAFGIRPWRLSYKQPDLVVLAEVNGRRIGTARRDGADVPNTGGNVVTTGPAILFSYRNYMFKAAVAYPVWSSLHGQQEKPGSQVVVGFETHF